MLRINRSQRFNRNDVLDVTHPAQSSSHVSRSFSHDMALRITTGLLTLCLMVCGQWAYGASETAYNAMMEQKAIAESSTRSDYLGQFRFEQEYPTAPVQFSDKSEPLYFLQLERLHIDDMHHGILICHRGKDGKYAILYEALFHEHWGSMRYLGVHGTGGHAQEHRFSILWESSGNRPAQVVSIFSHNGVTIQHLRSRTQTISSTGVVVWKDFDPGFPGSK